MVFVQLAHSCSTSTARRLIKQWTICVCEVIVHETAQTKRVTTRGNCAERDGGKSLKYTIVAMEVYNYDNNLATVSCFFPLSKGRRATALKHSLRSCEHKNEMASKSRRERERKTVVGHKMQRDKTQMWNEWRWVQWRGFCSRCLSKHTVTFNTSSNVVRSE